MSEWIIGIDPGKSGGIVSMSSDGTTVCIYEKMPATESDIVSLMEDANAGGSGFSFAYIEKVQAMRGKDGRKQGVTSAFNFGHNYGFLRGCLHTAAIPFEEVLPAKWQKAFGLIRTSKTETITQKKNRHKAKAQQLFPNIKITHAIADALLIAEYGRRLRGGML